MAKKSTNQLVPEVTPIAPLTEPVMESKEAVVADSKDEELPVTPSQVNRVIESPKEASIEFKKEEPLSTEEKVIEFLKARNTGGFIPISDFLKSLYPQGLPNSRKAWHDQRTMKLLKNTLDEMVKSRQIIIEGNIHQRLSKFFYPDSSTGATHYYNLDTLQLRAKLP